jgi:hypothetical protein
MPDREGQDILHEDDADTLDEEVLHVGYGPCEHGGTVRLRAGCVSGIIVATCCHPLQPKTF